MRQETHFAVLIDAENVSPKYVSIILEQIEQEGIATYKRIYGDWTSERNAHWKPKLLNHSIVPVQQFRYTVGKNCTDSAMIIDAMDILYAGRVQGFCLVSSDSDFTRLAMRLREAGMRVIGMGDSKTPTPFVTACERFVTLDILYGELRAMRRMEEQQRYEERQRRMKEEREGQEIALEGRLEDAGMQEETIEEIEPFEVLEAFADEKEIAFEAEAVSVAVQETPKPKSRRRRGGRRSKKRNASQNIEPVSLPADGEAPEAVSQTEIVTGPVCETASDAAAPDVVVAIEAEPLPYEPEVKTQDIAVAQAETAPPQKRRGRKPGWKKMAETTEESGIEVEEKLKTLLPVESKPETVEENAPLELPEAAEMLPVGENPPKKRRGRRPTAKKAMDAPVEAGGVPAKDLSMNAESDAPTETQAEEAVKPLKRRGRKPGRKKVEIQPVETEPAAAAVEPVLKPDESAEPSTDMEGKTAEPKKRTRRSRKNGEAQTETSDLELIRNDISAILQAGGNAEGWMYSGAVGRHLNKLRPELDLKTYGFLHLTDLIQALGTFEIAHDIEGKGNSRLVYIRVNE